MQLFQISLDIPPEPEALVNLKLTIRRTGAMLESHPEEGQTPPMKGSMLIVVAESPEAIREQLSKDIYATSGVWDIDNVSLTNLFPEPFAFVVHFFALLFLFPMSCAVCLHDLLFCTPPPHPSLFSTKTTNGN